MKVVGISGAQGGGKSTLLGELKNRGYNVDAFRVSRAVQANLGWKTLENVMESWYTMVEFQSAVYEAKFNHDLALASNESNDIVLTERTFADIVAYTNLWTWRHVDRGNTKFNEAMAFLVPYTKRCAEAQRLIYSGTILMPFMADVVAWEEDANRAARNDVDRVFEDVQRFMESKIPVDTPLLTITMKSVQDRADEVEYFLRSSI